MKKSELKENGFYLLDNWAVELFKSKDDKWLIRFPNEDCFDSTEYLPDDTDFVPLTVE